jgi:Domain of unknown function (DUF4476)
LHERTSDPRGSGPIFTGSNPVCRGHLLEHNILQNMSKISLVIVFLLQAGTGFAQKYFLFIDAENRQPFYVRVDSEFHSSSAEGHIILSQLKDTAYTIAIGFPGQTLPEQHYAFSILGKDQAFELRSQDANGLRLYDLQTNDWLSPQGGSGAGDDSRSAGMKKDDAFSRMMAGVVHDTAVLYNTYAMERALSDSPAVAMANPDTGASKAIAATAARSTIPSGTDTTATQLTTTQSAASQSIAGQRIDSTTTKPADTSATGALTGATAPAAATPPVAIKPVTGTIPATATMPPATATMPPASTTPAAAFPTPADSIRHTGSTDPTSARSPDATASRTADTTAARHNDTAVSRELTTSRPAGAITHQPAPRFNDSGAAPLYRPIPKDTSASAAPIPSAVGAPLYRSPGVVKLSERHSPKNVRLVYADHSSSKKADTIVIIIPVDSPTIDKIAGRQPHVADTSRNPSTRAHGPNPNADSPSVGAITPGRPAIPPISPAETSRPRPEDSNHRPTKTTAFVNSDCHDFASDFDVDKLRVKMLESGKDDDRITVARKTFKSKCFSTSQIRALSGVFTSDAAKFRFLEAAWPYAADEHFHELSDLLADPVYNGKFKTMTHVQ